MSIRVVETRDLLEDVSDVCLSYCWGKGECFRLDVNTHGSPRAGISINLLPKTIRDAVCVTKELGAEWLWVDSLCIIQDSVDDWTSEAATMCAVYQGCLLTIAAVGAAKNSDGLFAQRDPLMYTTCPIFSSSQSERFHAFPVKYSREAISVEDHWLLYKRGWVVQERVLPTRHLKFGPFLEWRARPRSRRGLQRPEGTRSGVKRGRRRVYTCSGRREQEESEVERRQV